MIQIFICSTPYHILLAHLTVEFINKEKKNTNDVKRILILTESAIIDNINEIIYEPIWNKTFILPYQKPTHIYKAKRIIDQWITEKGLYNLPGKKEVFINDDRRWRNQLLITGIYPHKISLIEDGMGAYIRNTYSFRERIYRGIILKSLFGKRLLNTYTISSIPADQFFAFRKNAYPWFGPDRNLHLLNYENSVYIETISQKNIISDQKKKLNSAELIILTSPLVEDRILSLKEELSAWKKLGKYLPHPNILAIKAHPREDKSLSSQRSTAIAETFSNCHMFHTNSALPAEFLLCNDDIQADIFGPNSTTLANLKSIRPDLNIYHGCDLFFSHSKIIDSMEKLAEYFDRLNVTSVLKKRKV